MICVLRRSEFLLNRHSICNAISSQYTPPHCFFYIISRFFSSILRQFVCEKVESTDEKIIVFGHHIHMLDKIEEETKQKVCTFIVKSLK